MGKERAVPRIRDMVLTIVASSQRLLKVRRNAGSGSKHKQTFIEDCLISKHNHLKLSIALQACQDTATGSTAGFCIKCANADGANDLWFVCDDNS
jgi:hypothetical protein